MNKKGQTMVEGMVAIFIIIVGIVGTLILALAAFSSSGESENQVKATNFAREALEVIRNKRDSNWLASLAFDDGLDYDYVRTNFNPSDGSWLIEQITSSNFDPQSCSEETCQLFYHPANGVFNHQASGGAQETNFYRLIQLNEICCNNSECYKSDIHIQPSGEECLSSQEKVGIQVLAKVVWQETNQLRTVVLEDRLFNWR